MKTKVSEIKAKHVKEVLEYVQGEIVIADTKYGFRRYHDVAPFAMHIDEFRNYTLMIPSEKNAKNIVERHSMDGNLTWSQMIIEEVAEAVQAVTPEEKFNELIQVAALAVNAAVHLRKEFYKDLQNQ